MEAQLFEPGTVPVFTTPEWYAQRESAPHLEQGGHRERLLMAKEFIDDAMPLGVVDLGAGDGGLLSVILKTPHRRIGYDLQQSNVDASFARGVHVELCDVVAFLPDLHDGDLVVCTEMLEHLIDPHGFVLRLFRSPARVIVASSPHLETAESHYEFHTWAWDMVGYYQLLTEAGWCVDRHETTAGFQVIRAFKP